MERKIVQGLLLGVSSNQLARELKVCKKTIKRIKERAQAKGYLNGTALPVYPEALFPEVVDARSAQSSEADVLLSEHRGWIKERLEVDEWLPITVYEELPVRVGRSSFYRFLKRHDLMPKASRGGVIPEIVCDPGEALVLDWGKLTTVVVDGVKRTVWMLIGVLGFSRYRMIRLVWSNKVEETLPALASMFDEIGGVPRRVTTDNPKCFATKADKYEPVLNPVAERFADYYGFILECLPPRDPQKKGKVERQVPYGRRLYQAHGSNWWGLEESQDYLNKKLSIANQNKHGTTRLRPVEVLKQEQEALQSLPTVPYDMEEYHKGTVRKDGCVRFRDKYYSVGEEHASCEVVIIGNSTQVSIYRDGQLLEVHERLTAPHRSKSIKAHHKRPWERTFEQQSLYRSRARAIGLWVEELVVTILAQGDGFVDHRKIWGILSLDKKYPAHIIDQACRLAHDQERWSYQFVKQMAETLSALEDATEDSSQQPFPLTKPTKFTRSIEEYSRKVNLTLIKGDKNEQRNNQETVRCAQNAHCSQRTG